MLINFIAKEQVALSQPEVVKEFLCPLDQENRELILKNRDSIHEMIYNNAKDGILMIAGPRIITSLEQIDCYLKRLSCLIDGQPPHCLKICLNVDICKRMSSHNSSIPFYLHNGLVSTRQSLIIHSKEFPIIGHICDELSFLYFYDLYSMSLLSCSDMGKIGSGLPMPVGFQAGFAAEYLDQVEIVKSPQSYLTILNDGQIGNIQTSGNNDCVIVIKMNELQHIGDILKAKLLLKFKLLINLGTITNESHNVEILELCKNVMSEFGNNIIGFIIDMDFVDEKQKKNEEPLKDCEIDIPIGIIKKPVIKLKFINSIKSSFNHLKNITKKQWKNKTLDSMNCSVELIYRIDEIVKEFKCQKHLSF